MRPMMLAGSFTDDRGVEPVTWRVADAADPRRSGTFDATAQIRGVRVAGLHFGALEPESPTGALPVNTAGEVADCVLRVEVPVVTDPPAAGGSVLALTFDLTGPPYEPVASAVLTSGDVTVRSGSAGTLEDVLGSMGHDPDVRLRCCYTCGLSDYSPSGVDLVGMRCHRDAREQYLAVRSRDSYWSVRVTEQVPEFYRCDRWEVRQPGTGYRG